MAEAAGLVQGVVGLAGIVGAFKDVIDLYTIIIDVRNWGRDFENLGVKFGIEKTLLLQWAERTTLLQPDYDHRLDDPTIRGFVLEILPRIKGYHILGIRRPVTDRFISQFQDFSLGINQRNKTTDWKTRFRWVVRDKQRFESLAADIAYFTAKLNEILPASNPNPQLHRFSRLSRNAIHALYEDRILKKLWFRKMDDRKETITSAHSETLRWALEPPQDGASWDDLSHWLHFESGIYWVCGKAGSGKSTLMKYLYHHPQTHYLLGEWASGPYVLANFFFWNLGTAEQKTQEGLSRALLYQILSVNRDLIPIMLPNMWKEASITNHDIDIPSIAETKLAFRLLAENTFKMSKICFFIDGLDEFVGDYMDGIQFVKDLAKCQRIKFVVSSRPIPDCVASFEKSPQLQLQHLTRGDIEAYIHDTISNHDRMKGLIRERSEDVSDELPPELEEMFQLMLQKVPQRYRTKSAEIFRMCFMKQRFADRHQLSDMYTLALALHNTNVDTLDLESLTKDQLRQLCDKVAGRLRSWCGGLLEITMPRPAGKVPICFCGVSLVYGVHDDYIDSRVDFMHRTVYEFLSQDKTWDLDCLQMENGDLECATALSLLGLDVAKFFLSQTSWDRDNRRQAVEFLGDGAQWGAKCDQWLPLDKRNMLWHLPSFLDQFASEPNIYHPIGLLADRHRHRTSTPNASHAALTIAVEVGAINYVKSHPEFLKIIHSPPHCGCGPALSDAAAGRHLGMFHRKDTIPGHLSLEMASLLFNSGSDPNATNRYQKSGLTSWEAWLRSVRTIFVDDATMAYVAEIAIMFLEAGANVENKIFDLREWVEQEFLIEIVQR
ncbi:hypothetical protein PT974_02991 [Cladobotryum mycophilum]|uniref:NACHT domain-containing protein n=1 Tax=Cladobotryum mycophilum TaxID=491253 RepID=A0ABR0SZU1_9HYPO